MRIPSYSNNTHHQFVIVTHANDSRGSKAFSDVCLSVCTQDKTKTAETTISKLATSRVLEHQVILGQKIKGHRVTECKTYSRRSRGRRELCTLSSAQPLVIIIVIAVVTITTLWLLLKCLYVHCFQCKEERCKR